MNDIKWNDSLLIGIHEVDQQHRNLVKIVNAVNSLDNQQQLHRDANKITFTLLSFARFHFRTEETLMLRHGYPEYPGHKNEHDAITEKVSAIHEQSERGDHVDFSPVFELLNNWFFEHTNKFDRTYVPFFVEKGVARQTQKPASKTSPDTKRLTLGKLSHIDWQSHYDFGIPDIDEQHRRLIYAVNTLYSTIGKPMRKDTKDLVEEAFRELQRYTTEHFNREEGLMEKLHYPDLYVHKFEHETFRNKIKDAKKRYDKYKTVVDHDLVLMLSDWFIEHAQTEDRKYLSLIERANAG